MTEPKVSSQEMRLFWGLAGQHLSAVQQLPQAVGLEEGRNLS